MLERPSLPFGCAVIIIMSLLWMTAPHHPITVFAHTSHQWTQSTTHLQHTLMVSHPSTGQLPSSLTRNSVLAPAVDEHTTDLVHPASYSLAMISSHLLPLLVLPIGLLALVAMSFWRHAAFKPWNTLTPRRMDMGTDAISCVTTSGKQTLEFTVLVMQKPKRRRTQRGGEAGAAQVEALDIKIRQMELRDTGPCFYLGEKTFTAGNLYRTWDEWEPVTSLSGSPEYCFVAEMANGRVVGFVLGSVVHKKNVSIGYIDWVVVDKAFQRLGVGTKLITKVTNTMRTTESITLLMADTPAENNAAVDFFMKHLAFTERIPHVYLTCSGDKRPPKAPPRLSDDTQVVVRRLIVDDLYKIHQLGEKVFNSHANLFRMWDENEVMDMFSQNSDYCLVATIDGEVAGFCLGTTVDKRRNKEPYGYLMWLAVDSTYGRKGIGTTLMHAFDEMMANQGVKQLFVDTQADNEPALKFFLSQGFGDKRMHVYMAKTFDANEKVSSESSELSSATAL